MGMVGVGVLTMYGLHCLPEISAPLRLGGSVNIDQSDEGVGVVDFTPTT